MKVPELRGTKISLSLLSVLFLLACPPSKPAQADAEKTAAASVTVEQEAALVPETPLPDIPERSGPGFALGSPEARPGDPLTVAYSDDFGTRGKFQALLLNAQGRRLARASFFTLPAEEGEQEIMAAVLAIPATAAPGNAVIRVENTDGTIIRDLPFKIEGREFISETISLNQENTDIRTVPDPQKTAESEQLWAILVRTGTEVYTTGVFSPPVASTRRTSHFGDRRVYRYTNGTSDTSIHAGLDYGVPTGTEVRAAARGRVVLAKNRIVTGNTVVLEHLPGVYSLYYHMDSISVTENLVVETGDLLGESGSTGLATGPHLHWEIRAAGEYADPDVFLSRPVIDKKEIIDKLSP